MKASTTYDKNKKEMKASTTLPSLPHVQKGTWIPLPLTVKNTICGCTQLTAKNTKHMAPYHIGKITIK